MRYVIIGNSTAGIGAVEGIRQVDKDGKITIITNEPHHTYSRPLISYYLLGKVTEEKMKYRGNSYYTENECEVIYGNVTMVETAQKRVVLSDGKVVPYDRILIAAGSVPLVPPMEGLNTVEERYTFMTLDDARNLDKVIRKDKKVLIIGAGLIGLKCAEGILERVSQVTVVDLAPRILSSILDAGGAELVQRHLERKGIKFCLSQSVKSFTNGSAVLSGGELIDFNILVTAVGVRPNTALLDGIAEIDRGIIIDERCKTSIQDVYAAGDCTQSTDVSSGKKKVMALLPNAYMQGECAGINMAGGDKRIEKVIPMNAMSLFGQHIITAGSYIGDEYIGTEGGNYKRIYYGGNRLNGYILIGKVEKAGIYTSLIREGTPLNSIDFELICEKPGLMAFTKEARMTKLGGEAG